MIVAVDTSSKVPPYEQVRTAIERSIADGDLRVGDRLPTVRSLAANLGLAPNTVARAYRELEAAGLLEGRGRRGTFVAPRTPVTAATAEAASARDAAQAYADRVRALGLDPQTALGLVRAALGLNPPPASSLTATQSRGCGSSCRL